MLDHRKITARINALSLSSTEAAQRAGMSKQSWWRIESGNRPDPKLSTVLAVCKALQCHVEDLIRKP